MCGILSSVMGVLDSLGLFAIPVLGAVLANLLDFLYCSLCECAIVTE